MSTCDPRQRKVSLVPWERSFYYSKCPAQVEPFLIAMSLKTFLVDLRIEAQKGKLPIVTDFLAHSLEQTLAKGEMSLLLLNRRGHARTLLCTACGMAHQCARCVVSMTVHKKRDQYSLLCHYCGKEEDIPQACVSCKAEQFKSTGFGIQQAEEELRHRFPTAKILRIDADTTKGKHAFTDLHKELHDGSVDIIIGTQMLAKGMDNPRITLVGVLDADIGLSIPDFRAEERTFQLLMQVLGRAGRTGVEGRVVIQTWMPESPSISCAATQDMEGFYAYLLEQRKTYAYPPFADLIKCTVLAKTESDAAMHAENLQKSFMETRGTLGHDVEAFVAPAYIPRQHGVFVYHVLLKGKGARSVLESTKIPTSVRVDVEPLQLL